MNVEEFIAQFEQEVIEIAAVTGMGNANGTSAKGYEVQGEGAWISFIGIIAWQDLSSGEIHKEQILLMERGAKAKNMKKALKGDSVVKLKVQKNREGVSPQFRFVDKISGGKFPELKKILKETKKTRREEQKLKKKWLKSKEPVYYHDEILGSFKLYKYTNCFEIQKHWCSESVMLRFPNENEEKMKSCVGFLRELFEKQAEWNRLIREYAVQDIIASANDWSEDHEISEEEFNSRITLVSIYMCSDGSFEFWFDDDNIFAQHSIVISGDMVNGPNSSDTPG